MGTRSFLGSSCHISVLPNIQALKKIDIPTYRDPEVVTLSEYPFMVPPSPFKQPAPLVASAIALTIIGAIFSGGSATSTNTYSEPSYYFGEVGSCYEVVTVAEGQKIQMSDCTNTSSTLKSVAVVDYALQCPSTSIYTTEANPSDGTTKTACLQYK